MNPRYALIVILPVLMHMHVGVSVAGTTVVLSMPWVIPVVFVAVITVLLVLFVLHLRNFRSSPYPRTVASWST